MTKSFNPNPITNHGRIDPRYQITLEYCGYPEPRYVARFMTDSHNGEFIGQSQFYGSALMLAVGHNQRRKGAMIIEEIRA